MSICVICNYSKWNLWVTFLVNLSQNVCYNDILWAVTNISFCMTKISFCMTKIVWKIISFLNLLFNSKWKWILIFGEQLVLGHFWFWGTFILGHFWFWGTFDFGALLLLGHFWFWGTLYFLIWKHLILQFKIFNHG